jgi:sulfopyruvate decarboxylase TPP-binding subunit
MWQGEKTAMTLFYGGLGNSINLVFSFAGKQELCDDLPP